MTGIARWCPPILLWLVVLQAAVAAALIAAGFWMDREARGAGPEAPVVAYAASLARGDLPGALEQLAPETREASSSFVQWQLGNRHSILESAVRGDSPLDRLLGKSSGATRVVAMLEILEAGKEPWRATEELPVKFADGRWYLLKPPLQLGP